MRISTFGRHIREGAKNVVRNGWMTFASISAISISLFVLGIFLVLALNVNNLADQIESQVEIRVYLEVNTSEQQKNAVQRDIASLAAVKKVTYVSKEEGLELLRDKMGAEGKELLEGFDGENNPLNDSFTIEVSDPPLVGQVAEQIKALDAQNNPPLIYKINYGKGTVDTLFKITDIVRNVGLVFVLLLAFTAMFLISNTIKITIVARRREIGIMKLVGATNSFIRWPFFIEGALLGIIGSAIPVGVLLWGYAELLTYTKVQLGLMLITLIPVHELILIIPALLLGIGVMIGIWGSILSVRKFLRV
ncbi:MULTISPECIES: permease-like cell division protein FtsX [Paenibacillus]|jgi:cell division transport system permease protein|uniref:Cell division protein FtsX n=1 Tax=Paenibacillus oceani TaxID=2772510 RepID=A0A927CBS0_9BACL|nr:permease-like cell division protein FtsX [Paenibacillus oceani]MBD2863662.1 ABC transporter permease [Paenibacillus oceani]MDF2663288.1 cell division protein FtsX [Paenibacillus sp.]